MRLAIRRKMVSNLTIIIIVITATIISIVPLRFLILTVETTMFGELSKSPSGTEVRTKPNGKFVRSASPRKVCKESNCTNKKNRFIVLGSSGEVLPVTRKSLGQMSVYSSCNSQSTDSFHSAKDTMDEEVGTLKNDHCSRLPFCSY